MEDGFREKVPRAPGALWGFLRGVRLWGKDRTRGGDSDSLRIADFNSSSSSSSWLRILLRTPGVLDEAFLLLALRHFEADSLVTECSDSASASAAKALPALTVARLGLTSACAARRMTARSGVGKARKVAPRDAGAAAGGEQGGEGGREGLGQGRGERAGASSERTRAESSFLKVLESQDSFTYNVSPSLESGNGASASRCITLEPKDKDFIPPHIWPLASSSFMSMQTAYVIRKLHQYG
ncbi:hypothetical protein EYF80_030263 [Liparis tanakae]|uniref:Uncharacterized protein n=1 Tax=Liparis tanakae TaxID=230148 RepID=A0A4Z2H1A0_9TELE|nr:hypothetical protein EYF80_030263 [Liparis tanakae]